jgi:hypothetical protein
VPGRREIVSGELESFGFHTIYDQTVRETIRIWVDAYWLSEDSALDRFNDKCG